MLERSQWIVFCWLVAAGALAGGCDDEACHEPDPRGEGQIGEACVTTRDCAEGLACIGHSFFEDALCSSPSQLPGGADPGCLDHAADWDHHQSDGVDPPTTDVEGCDLLIFVSSCNCQGTGGDDCIPLQPLYRRETWRSCNGCCWRLVSFWQDDDACDDDP